VLSYSKGSIRGGRGGATEKTGKKRWKIDCALGGKKLDNPLGRDEEKKKGRRER